MDFIQLEIHTKIIELLHNNLSKQEHISNALTYLLQKLHDRNYMQANLVLI